jgi:hypothetical protein
MILYNDIDTNKKIYISEHYFLIFFSFLSFLISANLAWFNPYQDAQVYKVMEIPFLWQFNRDVPVEILSSTGFLEYFERDPTRIERPGLPFLAYIIGHAIYSLIFKIVDLPLIYFTAGSYVLVNFFLHYITSILLYKILKIYFSENISKIGIIIFFLNYITIRHFAEIHTFNMHLLSPIIIAYLTLNFLSKENFLNLFLLSFVIGLLILIKSLYSFYITVLLLFFLKKRYLVVIQSIIIHSIPIIIWLLILKLKNIEFYSATMLGNVRGQEVYMVTWFLNDLMNYDFQNIFNQLFYSLENFSIVFIKYYNFLIIFIFMGFINLLKSKNNKMKRDFLLISFLIICLSFIQFLMAKKNITHVYMGGDYFLLCLFYVLFFLKKVEPKKFLVTIILILAFLINTIKLPYVSPYDQKGVEWEKKFKPNSKSLKYFE